MLSFGQNSMAGCWNLEYELDFQKIDVGGRGGSYGDSTFSGSGLKGKVDIKEGPTNISNFEQTKIESIIFPSTTVQIAWNVCYNCQKLKYARFKSITPPIGVNNYTFQNTGNCPIYVPDESLNLYKEATNWIQYANRIKPFSEFVEIV